MIDKKELKDISSVLFICMGNICRSPTAEAVFRHKAKAQGVSLHIDSAGTLGSHAKEKPDHRAIKAGEARGYSFSGLRARKVTPEDFEKFDMILAMDESNLEYLLKKAPEEYVNKVQLFLDYGVSFDENEVPDPYYGGAGGFNYVLDLVEDASDNLLKQLK
ncbi:MAG: low molecular weight protein-tyrosine-phosphatase [Thalassotalea sp.]